MFKSLNSKKCLTRTFQILMTLLHMNIKADQFRNHALTIQAIS